MKSSKILYLIIACSLIILSCSDNDNDADQNDTNNDYYVTLKANGNPIAFTGQINDGMMAGTFNELEADETDQYGSGFSAVSPDGSHYITILLGTLETVQLNTIYTNYSTLSPRVKGHTYVSTLSTNSGLTVFGSINEEALLNIEGTVADCEITFTEVTDIAIYGTFTGTWYNFEDDIPGLQITEGKFKVQRYRN